MTSLILNIWDKNENGMEARYAAKCFSVRHRHPDWVIEKGLITRSRQFSVEFGYSITALVDEARFLDTTNQASGA
jgi:hypothetical protein